MKRSWMLLALLPAAMLLTVMCISGPPGSQERVDLSVVVNVFADQDGDGLQGKDEPGIPGVLTAAHYNEHGFHERSAMLTGEDGQVTFSGTYTHFFDVGAAAPCGYQATTESTQSAASSSGLSLRVGKRQRDFGFLFPSGETPLSEAAQITFELWQDLNRNGRREEDEDYITGQTFTAAPYNSGIDFLWPDPADIDDFALTSEPNGKVVLALGSSCGQVAVRFPSNPGPEVTASQPIAGRAEEAEGVLIFPYGPGVTVIAVGLAP
jgi:hypothetical protein